MATKNTLKVEHLEALGARRLAELLIAWTSHDAAAKLVVHRAGELNGDFYDLLNLAAASLAADHPLATTLALRAMMAGADATVISFRRRWWSMAVHEARSTTGFW